MTNRAAGLGVAEAGRHLPAIRPLARRWLANCPDCTWHKVYESEREARIFAWRHHRRLGQIPGQLVLV